MGTYQYGVYNVNPKIWDLEFDPSVEIREHRQDRHPKSRGKTISHIVKTKVCKRFSHNVFNIIGNIGSAGIPIHRDYNLYVITSTPPDPRDNIKYIIINSISWDTGTLKPYIILRSYWKGIIEANLFIYDASGDYLVNSNEYGLLS